MYISARRCLADAPGNCMPGSGGGGEAAHTATRHQQLLHTKLQCTSWGPAPHLSGMVCAQEADPRGGVVGRRQVMERGQQLGRPRDPDSLVHLRMVPSLPGFGAKI